MLHAHAQWDLLAFVIMYLLLMKLCKSSLYSCQDIKEFDHESDMAPPKA